MPRGNYAHPPITEAVIETRFVPMVGIDSLRRISRRVREQYPDAEDLFDIDVTVGTPQSQTRQRHTGLRLTSRPFMIDVLQLKRDSLTTSRLAPYIGWANFRRIGRENFDVWRSVVGKSPRTVRIGSRYINRVDIPQRGEPVNTFDFVPIQPSVPAGVLGDLKAFGVHVSSLIPDDPAINVLLNTSQIPSPLIGHTSVLLDIDVYIDHDLPQDDDQIWSVAERLHNAKNAVFEGVITDRARELFDHA
jgi:uncharacterized protein (TIGR04255 family)